jgi:PPE-repeat protein
MALQPRTTVWVDAPPEAGSFIVPDSYLIAIADAAAYGGRWIVSLDGALASSLAAGKPDADKPWKRILQTAAFFAARKPWSEYAPAANIGVVSDFTGANEFFSHELLNLLARAGAHARPVPAGGSFEGLRAIIYPDAASPSAALRGRIEAFVKAGGLLMTSEKRPLDDPYLWANDAVVMVSHRYDLVRFWNSGATGSFVATSPQGGKTIVHLLFYSMRGPDSASVRVAGRFRTAKAATVEQPAVANVECVPQEGGIEVHLPPVSQYVALELE